MTHINNEVFDIKAADDFIDARTQLSPYRRPGVGHELITSNIILRSL